MKAPRPRTAVTLLLAVLLLAIGFWLGEAGGPAWAALPILTGVGGCLFMAVAAQGGSLSKLPVALATMTLYGVAFFAGLHSFDHAFTECLEQGGSVRAALGEFHRIRHTYPDNLAQLDRPIPCNRISRPTILRYQRTKTGYDLRLADWLVEHVATEATPFTAHK